MAVDKPTERAQEAIAESARLAGDRGNQVVEPEHLLLALLDAREGVVEPVLAAAPAPTSRRCGPRPCAAIERRARGERRGRRRPALERLPRRSCAAPARRPSASTTSTSPPSTCCWRCSRSPRPAREALRGAGVTRDGLLARAAAGARLGAGDRPQPRGQVPGARAVRPRPHRGRRAGQARPGDRPRRGDPAGHPGPVAPHQEQPGADRRARHRQDRDRRGPGPADRGRRHPRGAGRQARRRAGRRRPARGREVPRRVRGPPEGRAAGDPGRRRPR